jgi:Flp pilus assembly protein TadD
MPVWSESLVLGPVSQTLSKGLKKLLPVAVVCGALAVSAFAGDLRINLPRRTKPTPVQDLNREGVKAVERHNYDRAKRLFYKAYLLDPDDPFTLNNLGYIAELEGDVERASRYYDLSQQMESEALVDKSTTKELEGKTVASVAGNAATNSLQVNRLNVAAIGLLQKDRAPEADVLLTRALTIDPKNAFTLNNLGFAKEKEGELENALAYYTKAANTNSDEPVIVTVHSSWRGKPIRGIAERNAKSVRELLTQTDDADAHVARLNLQGVSALNRNDRRAAREYFQQAYKLRQDDAFTLNNMGYLAEMDGDRETANYYYQKAQAAEHAAQKVGIATRKEAEGQPLATVASTSTGSVDARMQRDLEIKRREGGPVVLRRRDGQPVLEPREAKRPTPRETGDVVAIPIPKGDAVSTPENAAPANNPPQTPTVEQPQGTQPNPPQSSVPQSNAPQSNAPQATTPQANPPQMQQQQQEEPLVQPQELEQPPNPQTSTPQEPPK